MTRRVQRGMETLPLMIDYHAAKWTHLAPQAWSSPTGQPVAVTVTGTCRILRCPPVAAGAAVSIRCLADGWTDGRSKSSKTEARG